MGWREIDLYWQDANTDGRVTAGELWGYDWDTDTLMDPNDPDYWLWSGGVNIDDQASIVPTNRIDPNINAPLLDELTISYEREIFADFAARLEFFYKKQHKALWSRGMFADGTVDSADNWSVAGTGPETGATYYGRTVSTPYRYRTNYDQRYERYLAGQIVLKKRLSNKWMLDASFTYSDWKQFHKGEFFAERSSTVAGGPNNGAYYDEGVVAPESGGSGVRGIYVNSRWQFKFSGLYQMPYGFNIAGVFRAREGYIIPTNEQVYVPGIGTRELYGPGKFGDERLPAFWMLDLRLEKVFNVTETSTVIFAVDAFNITNSAHVLKEEPRLTAATFGDPLRILNPRVIKFGIIFNF